MRCIAFGIAASLCFATVYVVLDRYQFYHWLITNGLLFGVLWALPRRWWPWIFTTTVFARVVNGAIVHLISHDRGPFLWLWHDPIQFALGNLPEPALVATGVLLLQRLKVVPDHTTGSMEIVRLHLAALVSSAAVVCKDVLYVLNDGFIADVRLSKIIDPVPIGGAGSWDLVAWFAIKNLMGNFVGIMMIAPIAFWLSSASNRAGSKRIVSESLLQVLPVCAAFLLLGALARGTPLAELLRLLLLAAVVVSALRSGWRGAALTTFAISTTITIDDYIGLAKMPAVWMQLFVAITGATGLMFGAAIDDLQQQRRRLATALDLASTLSTRLRDAAARNLDAEERERRRLAAELHDEFGQNLAALQTRLKLAEPDFAGANRPAVLDGLLQLTHAMRQNIARVLEALRPAALDEIGLYAAIDRGSVRKLVQDAGIRFQTSIEGDARLLALLGDTHRIAAYRLVQEASTNIVRHAHASTCSVRLRVNRRGDTLWLFLDIRDDGIGGSGFYKPGNGLANMRDRAVALGGRFHLRDLDQGLRVHALLREQIIAEKFS